LFMFCGLLCVSPTLAAERFKVLVVFSYEENAPWDIEIREEIEKVLGPFSELSFFYMDTKVALEGGSVKASEAFSLYQQIQPDGVIAVDDNAQSMFVVPYLKNRETIPIMFCGVNGNPELYGYPTENISGILERFHLEESISLSKQLAGNIKTFAFMVKEGPVADLISEQLEMEKHQLSAKMVKFLTPRTMEEAVEMAESARGDADLLFLVALWGMVDSDGKKVEEEDAIPQLVAAFGKPTAAIGASVIREGALSAVITNAREHGERVAGMLLQAMRGVPMAQLPMVRNCYGKRMINVSSLRQLGLTPEPIVLRGVDLVRNRKCIISQ
jgi:ABC-type uncharacterized transport system substrate-binding protein